MAATSKEKFDAAVKVIQTIPKDGSFMPSHDMMLRFYAYFKQATLGPITTPRPAFWDVVGKAKWDAWKQLGDMPPDEAMNLYVAELKKIVEAMPHTDDVQGFVEKLGDFYEAIDEVPPGVSDEVWRKRQAMYKNSKPENGGVPPYHTNGGHVSDDYRVQHHDNNDNEIADQDIPILMKSSPDSHIPSHLRSGGLPEANGHLTGLGEGVVGGDDEGVGEVREESVGCVDEDDRSSEGDEFCDTSDLPLIQNEVAIDSSKLGLPHPVLDASNSLPYANGPMWTSDMDQSDSGISHQSESRDPLPPSAYSYRSGLTKESSTADFTLGPSQLLDRNWSHVGLDELNRIDSQSNLEQCDVVVTRGGGDNALQGGAGAVPRRTGSGSRLANQPGQGGVGSGSGRHRSQWGTGGSTGAGGGQGGGSFPPSSRGDVNEEISVTVIRLQEEMSHVLARLEKLEKLSLEGAPTGRVHFNSTSQDAPWWWPFGHMNRQTVFFLVVWPLLVHWAIVFISRRSKRAR